MGAGHHRDESCAASLEGKATRIAQYLLENTDINPTLSDRSGNLALYYAKTILPHGGPLLELI